MSTEFWDKFEKRQDVPTEKHELFFSWEDRSDPNSLLSHVDQLRYRQNDDEYMQILTTHLNNCLKKKKGP